MPSPPLAERLRPKKLEDVVGQEHLTAPGKPLEFMVRTGNVVSMILWGPPGTGKTTLAEIIAQSCNRKFHYLSAIKSGIKDIKNIFQQIESTPPLLQESPPILFIDEIHRFNKTQQDSLLHAVERGRIVLIGATTENPSFEVQKALLSRMHVYVLEPLNQQSLRKLIEKALTMDPLISELKISLEDPYVVIRLADGDARRLLNLLELIAMHASPGENLTAEKCMQILQRKTPYHDQTGEEHYNLISAFIKSIRNSDADAAVYYLARMLAGGEDPMFIARRLLILASEDVGLANPTALVLANATMDAVYKTGMPEARIPLSMCTIYLAQSPKSNSAYEAINKALTEIELSGNLPVPMHLRNAPTKLMKDLGYGSNYQYPHHFENNIIAQPCLPEKLIGTTFYTPGKNEREQAAYRRIQELKKASPNHKHLQEKNSK